MLAVTRFRYADGDVDRAFGDLAECIAALETLPGYVCGVIGRALDDPTLWMLSTTWESVGAYRRALSSYDAKMRLTPALAKALDEPSAYEVLTGTGAGEPNEAKPRGAT